MIIKQDPPFSNLSIKELEQIKKLQLSIPKIKKVNPTALYIAGLSHLEKTSQNFYAYFLNQYNHKEFSHLVLSAFVSLINQKRDSFPLMNNWDIITETSTNSGKRVDILIEGLDDLYPLNIIIELKIRASLYNDLEDYWDNYGSKHSIGLVISIFPIETTNNNFINITHSDLCHEIKKKYTKASFKLPTNEEFIFYDFINSIQIMTDSTKNTEVNLAFYEENRNLLSKLEAYRTLVYDKIIKATAAFAQKVNMEVLVVKGKDKERTGYYDFDVLRKKSFKSVGISVHMANNNNDNHLFEIGFDLLDDMTNFRKEMMESEALNTLYKSDKTIKKSPLHLKGKYYCLFYKEYKSEDLIEQNDITKSFLNLYETEWKVLLEGLESEAKRINAI